MMTKKVVAALFKMFKREGRCIASRDYISVKPENRIQNRGQRSFVQILLLRKNHYIVEKYTFSSSSKGQLYIIIYINNFVKRIHSNLSQIKYINFE